MIKFVSLISMSIVLLFSVGTSAQSFPNFDQDYWEKESEKAKGKIWRGAGLGVLGLASIVPTTILIRKAVDDPEGYLAYSAVAGIATIGMTLHGFFSIGFGKEQMDKSDGFIKQYENDPSGVDNSEERDFYLYAQKKTTAKVILFGSTLVLQSVISLTNGIVLSVRKKRKTWGGSKIWPSYLIGGLLLPAGIGLIVNSSIEYSNLKELETRVLSGHGKFSIAPYFDFDPLRPHVYHVGLNGMLSF